MSPPSPSLASQRAPAALGKAPAAGLDDNAQSLLGAAAPQA